MLAKCRRLLLLNRLKAVANSRGVIYDRLYVLTFAAFDIGNSRRDVSVMCRCMPTDVEGTFSLSGNQLLPKSSAAVRLAEKSPTETRRDQRHSPDSRPLRLKRGERRRYA